MPSQPFRESNPPETKAYHTRGGTRLRGGLKISLVLVNGCANMFKPLSGLAPRKDFKMIGICQLAED